MAREYINVIKLIQESNYNSLKRLPQWIMRIIRWIVKEDEINRTLNNLSDDYGVDFLPAVIKELDLKPEIEGSENLPENPRCFFVANHPYGFVDGMVMGNIVAGKYGDLRAIGNEVHTFFPQAKPFIAAVNVFGYNPRHLVLELEKVYQSDIPITHFPAGEVSRIHGWKIQDCAWHKSVIKKAVSCKRDIVPLYFSGRNSRLFYFVNLFRRLFGIKTNLELVLLPREIFNKRGKQIKVRIGKPIPYSTFDDSLSQYEWAQELRKLVFNQDSKIKVD